MKHTFYIGGLEISYESGIIPQLEPFDAKFHSPVLPITSHAQVTLQVVDSLQIPSGPSRMLGTRKVWREQAKETRLYTASKPPYLMSILEQNLVTIYAEEKEWHRRQLEFRPWFNIHLEQLLLNNHALVLHSASIIVDGRAIIFSAPSGTGKTTQTDLWHQYHPGTADLNGDRTLLQWTENGWFACGFPVYGSSIRCEQCAVPIAGIVIIRQGNADHVRELTPLEKISLLYSETTVPALDAFAVNAVMDLIEKLANDVTVVQLTCTMGKSAVGALQAYLNI